MKQTVGKASYGNYSSDNYGAHTQKVWVGNLTLWFSYDTVVAFRQDGHCMRVSENCWGPTTGKHLNFLDGGNKADRFPRERFENELANVLNECNLVLA